MTSTIQINELEKYLALSDRLNKSYNAFAQLQNTASKTKQEYESIQKTLMGYTSFYYKYSTFENEMNDFIGSQLRFESIETDKKMIVDKLNILVKVDKKINELQKYSEKLESLPDRHNKKTVLDKIAMFLNSVGKITIKQVAEVDNRILPMFNDAIKKLEKDFKNEAEVLKEIEKKSTALLAKADKHLSHQNRHKLHFICENAKKTIQRIILNPNYQDLQEELSILEKVDEIIISSEKKFESEKLFYNNLKKELIVNSQLLWKEDYDLLMEQIDRALDNIYTFPNETNSIQLQYDQAKDTKNTELNRYIPSLKDKIRRHFENQIDTIRNTSCYRTDFLSLTAKVAQYEKDLKKKLILAIVKWLAITVVTVIAIMLIIEYWQYVLGGVIVIGIIWFFIARR